MAATTVSVLALSIGIAQGLYYVPRRAKRAWKDFVTNVHALPDLLSSNDEYDYDTSWDVGSAVMQIIANSWSVRREGGRPTSAAWGQHGFYLCEDLQPYQMREREGPRRYVYVEGLP